MTWHDPKWAAKKWGQLRRDFLKENESRDGHAPCIPSEPMGACFEEFSKHFRGPLGQSSSSSSSSPPPLFHQFSRFLNQVYLSRTLGYSRIRPVGKDMLLSSLGADSAVSILQRMEENNDSSPSSFQLLLSKQQRNFELLLGISWYIMVYLHCRTDSWIPVSSCINQFWAIGTFTIFL